MYCNRCGKEVDQSWQFCRYCGAPVGKVEKTNHVNTKKKIKKTAQKPSGGRRIITAICLTMIMLTAMGFFIRHHRKVAEEARAYLNDLEIVESIKKIVETELPGIDVEAYFEERSEIIRVIDAAKSSTISTEKGVMEDLASRGFDVSSILTDYTTDGVFCPGTPISADSSAKHPVYTVHYINAEGEYWTIYEINGSVMAYPVSYNLQRTNEVELIITETDTIISYDNQKNQFYETIPNSSELIVKQIDRICAESLNLLTTGAIDAV